jgi:hypothetical protein
MREVGVSTSYAPALAKNKVGVFVQVNASSQIAVVSVRMKVSGTYDSSSFAEDLRPVFLSYVLSFIYIGI